ncbi:hypothetical protein AMECASPLE_033291 [Ameca splendens]|uniref:Uncharacterized protein n=1 Tax=Ameca splendens TaxID=208324 RepID=A0ABV0XJU8_9TELE
MGQPANLVQVSACFHWSARGGVHPGQVIHPSQGTTETHRQPESLERTNACRGRTCMQDSFKKTPGQDLTPGPSCCKATVLTTAPICNPR